MRVRMVAQAVSDAGRADIIESSSWCKMVGAVHRPPGYEELVAHMQRVLPLRYDDEAVDVNMDAEAGLGYGGAVGLGGADRPRSVAARL